MCGLWVSVGLPRLPDALAAVARRGPDGEGERTFDTPAGRLILGHRRLAISDPAASSAQPFSLEGEGLDLVWNGAVYDFRERRAALSEAGVAFGSTGDTEVLLRLMQRRGLAALTDLDAMFALALYDRGRRRLTLARDRFGEKPLLYARGRGPDGPWFAAGSDLRQFLDLPGLVRRIDAEHAAAFLNWGAPDALDRTFLTEVRRLPAGAALELDLSSPQTFAAGLDRPPAAWPGARLEPVAAPSTPETAAEALREALATAVRRRLVSSDVAYGACVSGGLDSSLIVGLMQALDGRCVGVSALVDDPAVSERPWIDALRAELDLDLVEVAADAASAAEAFEPALLAQGEPIPNSSVLLQWRVFQAARTRGLKVMLDGQGADELFGGYPGMLGAWLADRLRRDGPVAWSREISALTRDGPGYDPSELRRATFRAIVPEGWRRAALTAAGRWPPKGFVARGAPPPARPAESFEALSERLLNIDSLPSLLRYEDRNAMDWGVETRLPYLAPGVVALAAGLPAGFKVRGGWRKAVLRDAADGLVPQAIRDRRRKLGFSTPHDRWTAGQLGELCREIVGDLRGSPAADLLVGDPTLSSETLFRTAAYLRWADAFRSTP